MPMHIFFVRLEDLHCWKLLQLPVDSKEFFPLDFVVNLVTLFLQPRLNADHTVDQVLQGVLRRITVIPRLLLRLLEYVDT